jgi:hypothetical protein
MREMAPRMAFCFSILTTLRAKSRMIQLDYRDMGSYGSGSKPLGRYRVCMLSKASHVRKRGAHTRSLTGVCSLGVRVQAPSV